MLWDVHQDTVPVDGMTVDPFGGESARRPRVRPRGVRRKRLDGGDAGGAVA